MGKGKVVLAYSGGLDTTVIIPWLKENYDYDVIAVCVDVGQGDDWKTIKQRALDTGASACHVVMLAKSTLRSIFGLLSKPMPFTRIDTSWVHPQLVPSSERFL